jgi:hypothetical protein
MYLSAIPLTKTSEEIKMKTSEILKTIHDDILILKRLRDEEQNAILKEIDQEKQAHKQKLEELEEKYSNTTWDAFAARNPDKIKIADEATEKMMTLIKSIDNDKVKRWLSFYERGVITQLELIQQFSNETIHVSTVKDQKTLTETNW